MHTNHRLYHSYMHGEDITGAHSPRSANLVAGKMEGHQSGAPHRRPQNQTHKHRKISPIAGKKKVIVGLSVTVPGVALHRQGVEDNFRP